MLKQISKKNLKIKIEIMYIIKIVIMIYFKLPSNAFSDFLQLVSKIYVQPY